MEIFQRKSADEGVSPFESNSLSGHERNRLFMQKNDNFVDATTVSGADFQEDGRGFVLFDMDQDGWVDMGIVSTSAPRFRLMKNKFSQLNPKHRSIQVSLEGGNHTDQPSQEWSSRDAYGATVTATVGETKRIFQLTCGEGLSSQNSKSIHIGLGEAEKIDLLMVKWPSGKSTRVENVAAGTHEIIREKSD